MEELSIEEKAKRYNEAIKKLKVLHDDWATTQNRAAKEVEEIFPEFTESKDDRIRKSLVAYFAKFKQSDTDFSFGDIVAWLEKQGQQPKKHDVCDNCDQQGSCVSPCPMKLVEKQGEQKTTIEMKTPEESLGIDSDTYNKIVDECIYGEQKPAEIVKWSPEEESCICQLESLVKEQWRKAEKVHNSVNVKKMSELMFFLKTLNPNKKPQRIISAEVKEAMYDKPAWSEEDIELLDNTIKFIEDRVAATSPSLRTYSPTLTGKEIPFLKSIKDRVQPHLKQEWSDYDECMLTNLIDDTNCSIDSEYVHWLKSLKERYTWKPSELQIGCLSDAVKHYNSQGYPAPILKELLSDLKKLKV